MKEVVTQIKYLGPSKLFSDSNKLIATFTAIFPTYTSWKCQLCLDKDSSLREAAELVSTFFNSPNAAVANSLSLQIYGQDISLLRSTQNNNTDHYFNEIVKSLKIG